jgi:hypothetical protein
MLFHTPTFSVKKCHVGHWKIFVTTFKFERWIEQNESENKGAYNQDQDGSEPNCQKWKGQKHIIQINFKCIYGHP